MPDSKPRWRSLPVVVLIGLLVSWLSLLSIVLAAGALLTVAGAASSTREMGEIHPATIAGAIVVAIFLALSLGGFVATRLYGDSLPQPSLGVGLGAAAVMTFGSWYQQGHFDPAGLVAALVLSVPGAVAGGMFESRRAER